MVGKDFDHKVNSGPEVGHGTMPMPEDKFVRINDLSLHYLDWGQSLKL